MRGAADTFGDLLALVDFGSFFFEEFVSLLTEFQELCARDTCLFNFDENFLADFGRCFEFCEGVGIRQGIVLQYTCQSHSIKASLNIEAGEGEIRLPRLRLWSRPLWILRIVGRA